MYILQFIGNHIGKCAAILEPNGIFYRSISLVEIPPEHIVLYQNEGKIKDLQHQQSDLVQSVGPVAMQPLKLVAISKMEELRVARG